MKVKELLRKKSIKPTVHRVEILEYLLKSYNHPTADEIYDHLKNEEKLAVLSRATVYNTLRVLAEAGIISAIITPDAVRYDFVRNEHHHFYCTKCKTVYDIDIDIMLPEIKSVDGHEVQHIQLTLVGVCSKCRVKMSKE